MKTRALIALSASLGGILIITQTAAASYQYLSVFKHTTAPVNGINRDVWRVYAMCTNPLDRVSSAAGTPGLGAPITIETRDSTGMAPGGDFVNPAGGGVTAPTFKWLGTQVEWDTFVTIGLAFVPEGVEDYTGVSPGWSGLGNVSSYSGFVGWYAPSSPQQVAGNGTQFGSLWGVLLMQLTVNQGNFVAGTVAIGGVNANPGGGGTTFQTMVNQTFDAFPAPSALYLFALSAVIGRPRRRPFTA